jgi:hypothetical protein
MVTRWSIITSLFLLIFIVNIPVASQTSFESLFSSSINQYDTSSNQSVLLEKKKTKSTTTAILLSTVLPGAGQLYNESYWKIPVILGLGGYWGYEWIQMNNEYRNYRRLYSESLNKILPASDYRYKTIRDFYKSERDRFAWYLGVLYFVNILDAYVDASLFEFSVDDNLSVLNKSGLSLKFQMKIVF